MTKVLILGATGNLGSATARALTANYADVALRLASSRVEGCKKLQASFPGAEVVLADWYDPASLLRAATGVDKVFVVTPDFTTDELIVTPNIINAIKQAGGVSQVIRFIAIPPGLTSADLAPEFLATRCGANLHTLAKPLLDDSKLPLTYINAACWIMFNLPWFIAEDVRSRRELVMPSVTDAARLHISELDIAAVAARIIADNADEHVGKEYLVTGTERFDYRKLAALLSDVLGETVAYVDSDRALRKNLGQNFDSVMTYFRHETVAYSDVPITDTVRRVTGRPTTTLREYISSNTSLFA